MKHRNKPGFYDLDEIGRMPKIRRSSLMDPAVENERDREPSVAIEAGSPPDRNRKAYCYQCGSPWPTESISCPACRGHDKSWDEAKPSISTPDQSVRFPFPWDLLPWPKQGTACIVGGPGSGKSSLVALLGVKEYLSREMEPRVIGEIARRIRPGLEVPKVRMVETAEDVERHLRDIRTGPIALDSATALASPKDSLIAAKLVDAWAKAHDDRGAVIVQVNKAGESAGYMQIPHLFDTVVELDPDPWGVRALRVPKSRWTSTGARYWTFDEHGRIGRPLFDAAYSVEGTPGNYWLHPYPLQGAKWTGVLKFLESINMLAGGCATAAIGARYMKNGFVSPPDVSERKRFAIENGLPWIGPEDLPMNRQDDEEVKPKRGRKAPRQVKIEDQE